MSEYTTNQINLEITRLQQTLDLLKKDLVTYPPVKDICMILINTIASLKSSLQHEQAVNLINNQYRGETLPFKIESIKQPVYAIS